jgi:hypothetical protein
MIALRAHLVVVGELLGIEQLTALRALDPEVLRYRVLVAILVFGFWAELATSLKEITHLRGIPIPPGGVFG